MSQMHLVEQRLLHLPWYVTEFIEYKGRKSSESTLLDYCRDYELFFNWLLAEGYHPGPAQDVPLSTLEVLRAKDVVSFESHCSKHRGNSKDTIARRLASLKSLFHYLSQIAEDDDLYPYLKRNVMARIDINRESYSDTEKAKRISTKILLGDEIEKFREFVAEGYGKLVADNKRKLNYYLHNRERDLAIISLILGSGLRVAEVVSIDKDQIDWNNQNVSIRHKGGKYDTVVFSDIALADLLEYKQIREHKYPGDKSEKALFLSLPSGNGKSTRFTKSSAQKMVNKYADAFGKGNLSIHKLRHTFATKHYQENKDIATLKRQLGHGNINTTNIYTHVFDNTLRDSVNKADK